MNYDQPVKVVGSWYKFELSDGTTIRVKPTLTGVLTLSHVKNEVHIKVSSTSPTEVKYCPPKLRGPPSTMKYTAAELQSGGTTAVDVKRSSGKRVRHVVDEDLVILIGVSIENVVRATKYGRKGCPRYIFDINFNIGCDVREGGRYGSVPPTVNMSVNGGPWRHVTERHQ